MASITCGVDEDGLQVGALVRHRAFEVAWGPLGRMLSLAVAALESDPAIVEDPERLRELLTSNLCRCTGYEPIRRAIESAAKAL
ncbi:2Fe-2S iron-sulfur cluster-binding protein [Streptosporangium sp. NPDC001681]|uniref:2Fe-2S iron-sulfur cluster-binding protein n=1 Tax=Streptosporangium sp. NPDC001681 TaxID=3154395 RepID=UPI00333425DF